MEFPILFRKFVSLTTLLAIFWLCSGVRSRAVVLRCLIPEIKDILSIFPCVSLRGKDEVNSVSKNGTDARFLDAYLGQFTGLLSCRKSSAHMSGKRGSVL
jgi:hypothetical protein